MTRPAFTPALLLSLGVLAAPSVAAAQAPARVRLGVAAGVSFLGPGTFARAFDQGPTIGLSTTVYLSGRLSLRVALDHDALPYDRERFFRTLGIDSVDLDGQLGAEAVLTTWSVGPEVAVWRRPAFQLYAFGMFGRASRSTSTAPLVSLYCNPPTPSGCDRVLAETQVEGSGARLAIGTGIRWHYRARILLSVEAGYAHAFLSPAVDAVPIRLGYAFTF